MKIFLLVCLLVINLIACGQKGALYLPEQAPMNQKAQNHDIQEDKKE